jgi:hypothetical protein
MSKRLAGRFKYSIGLRLVVVSSTDIIIISDEVLSKEPPSRKGFFRIL